MSSEGVGAVAGEEDKLSGLLPAARFPEFHHAEKWQLRKLSDLLFEPKQRNRSLKYGPNDVISVSGEYGCVNQIEFMGRSYAGVSVKDYHIVETSDVVYTKSPLKASPFGIIKANKGRNGIVSTLYAVYRPTGEALANYIDHYFSSNYNLNSYLQPLVKKGPKNDMKVKNSDVLIGSIWVPKIDEQKKIADFLSSIDTLIAVEADILVALKSHKKGLIAKIFPAPGEVTPHFRFREFQDSGEWDEITLSDIGELVGGLTYSPSDVGDKGLLVLRSSNIQDGQIALEDCVFVDPNVKGVNLSQPDDILICVRNGSASLIGKNALIPKNMPLCTHGAFMTVFRTKLAKFVFQIFQTPAYQTQVSADLGATINSINGSQFLKYKFSIPKEPEQKRIAAFLTSIDIIISSQNNKVQALKAHKKGLMQLLFPIADQVQG